MDRDKNDIEFEKNMQECTFSPKFLTTPRKITNQKESINTNNTVTSSTNSITKTTGSYEQKALKMNTMRNKKQGKKKHNEVLQTPTASTPSANPFDPAHLDMMLGFTNLETETPTIKEVDEPSSIPVSPNQFIKCEPVTFFDVPYKKSRPLDGNKLKTQKSIKQIIDREPVCVL